MVKAPLAKGIAAQGVADSVSASPYGGAQIKHRYLDRKQDFVAVNKNDLEDILGFDGVAAFLGALGMFFLAGSTWLLIDKITQMQAFQFTPAVAVCLPSMAFGLINLAVGLYFHRRKRGRIQRIFDETTEIAAPR